MITKFAGKAVGGAQRVMHNLMTPTILEEVQVPPPPHDYTQEDEEFEANIAEGIKTMGYPETYTDLAIERMRQQHYKGRPRPDVLVKTELPRSKKKILKAENAAPDVNRERQEKLAKVERWISQQVEGCHPWER